MLNTLRQVVLVSSQAQILAGKNERTFENIKNFADVTRHDDLTLHKSIRVPKSDECFDSL